LLIKTDAESVLEKLEIAEGKIYDNDRKSEYFKNISIDYYFILVHLPTEIKIHLILPYFKSKYIVEVSPSRASPA